MFAAAILASSHDCSSPLWFLVFLSFFCLQVSRKGLCYNYNCVFLGYGLWLSIVCILFLGSMVLCLIIIVSKSSSFNLNYVQSDASFSFSYCLSHHTCCWLQHVKSSHSEAGRIRCISWGWVSLCQHVSLSASVTLDNS